jgi:pilus assembly protein CpaF
MEQRGSVAALDAEAAEKESAKAAEELKDALFRELPSKRIAELMRSDGRRARTEVMGVLRMLLRDRRYSDIGRQSRDELAKRVFDMVVGLGPIDSLVKDDSITEVMINGPGDVFYERDGRIRKSDAAFLDEEQLRIVVDRILGPTGRRVDERSPMISTRLAGGDRVNVIIPPVSLDGTTVTIRKFGKKRYSLADFVEMGSMSERAASLMEQAVLGRKNIAVSGGTGSGKTTLLNALSTAIPEGERIITIEDAAELKFDAHPHVVRLEARPASIEGTAEVTIRDLVTNALRMRPDRIIVGECRGGEALDMLQAMNTGHDGSLTTLHANSTRDVIVRLVMMARYVSEIPVEVIEGQIASAIDLIFHLERTPDGKRRLCEICSCERGDDGVALKHLLSLDGRDATERWSLPDWYEA